MGKELSIFSNDEFGTIRTVEIDGVVWFVASDVCKILGHTNTTKAMQRLDSDEKANFKLGLSGGGTNCVNEYGLYNLIMGSRKETAKSFKRWVTHEVIPSIRKTGEYSLNKDSRKAIREKSKEIRNRFTAMQKAHGYTEQHEYIQTTRQMKQKLGITAKKDDMTKQELATISAAEWLSIAMVTDEKGYYEVNPVCVTASETVNNAIASKQADKLLA